MSRGLRGSAGPEERLQVLAQQVLPGVQGSAAGAVSNTAALVAHGRLQTRWRW